MKAAAYSDTSAAPMAVDSKFTVADLVARVRGAVEAGDVPGVKKAFEESIRDHPGFLPEEFTLPKASCYARRELYSDPEGRFSIVAMVWSPGQGTMLHDHNGFWVVEAVYEGKISFRNFEYLGETDGLHQFREDEERFQGPGVSGYIVPPHEHHVLKNPSAAPTVTIHAFGGILKQCNVFEPIEGGYKMARKTMCFD